MNWKSTAAASGLMVVGTWLASHAPVGQPRPPAATSSTSRTETAAAEIQREANRLHTRLRAVTAFRQPARNLFQFGMPPASAPIAHRPVEPVAPIAPVVEPPAAPTLRVKLSGIGEDGSEENVVRTAIISTPDNVYILKIGETIGDTYKVSAISADSVELTRLDDGSTVQLSLRR